MERPHPDVVERMSALARLHHAWTLEYAADAEPQPNDAPDYLVHHLDIDPPPGAENKFVRRAREIEGRDEHMG
ncbi:hypothetical protein [Cryptosporangium arvum]|uniref:Uncharacterized protein n=1 Tax=Cryptosporangium arvum DSM 44712 TaxID=927661 RepID=A0A011ABA7_9ACTN|nr:hypothetical protein [Cryptosporangium arvum]EXG79271.1 hypothetical protein CryarDRAFT_0302 [Cryptosporangium arvum DSM 44712]